MDFAEVIARFAQEALAKSEEGFQNTCSNLSIAIQEDTPVLTGRLRGNWQPSINSPIESSIMEIDPSGGKVVRKIRDVCQKLKLGDTYFFTNNVIYGPRIEFYGHSSQKAPQGMVRINLLNWQGFIK